MNLNLNRVMLYDGGSRRGKEGWIRGTCERTENEYQLLDRVNCWMDRQTTGRYKFELWFGKNKAYSIVIRSDWIHHKDGCHFDLIECLFSYERRTYEGENIIYSWVRKMKEAHTPSKIMDGYPMFGHYDEKEWISTFPAIDPLAC